MLLELREMRLVEKRAGQEVDVRRDSLRIASDVEIDSSFLIPGGTKVIELEFPTYKDGRAYSQVHSLRQVKRFKGDVRATGDVLQDQILFMVRCGFTSFDVPDDTRVDDLNHSLAEFSCFYQPAAASAIPVWQLRRTAGQRPSQSV